MKYAYGMTKLFQRLRIHKPLLIDSLELVLIAQTIVETLAGIKIMDTGEKIKHAYLHSKASE